MLMKPPFYGEAQVVWDTVRALNDAWTQGHAADVARYFHPDMLAITPTDRLRREGHDACVAGWVGFADAAIIHSWIETDPCIRLYGNSAVVAYCYALSCDINGRSLQLDGRDMLMLVKEDGRWLVVADQFSGYPGGMG